MESEHFRHCVDKQVMACRGQSNASLHGGNSMPASNGNA